MSQFVRLEEAAAQLGIDRATLWRRIKRQKIQTHTSTADKRLRFIAQADLDTLKRLAERPEEGVHE